MVKQNTDKTDKDSVSNTEISVIIPLLNERDSLSELTDRIRHAIDKYAYEILFVDDGSDDGSWDLIESLSASDESIKGIKLRRNYGKSSALQAGFKEASGHFIITMDADLQDDPFEIPEMIQRLKKGADLVSGWKKVRHDPVSKTVPSRFFNAVTSWTTGIKLHDFNCGLKAYRRKVTEHIHLYGELHRYVPLLAKWQGFSNIEEQEVKHHPRKYGSTKFGLSRFMHGFLDLLTLLFVQRYMQRPMHFFGSIGVMLTILGLIINAYIAILKIFYGQPIGDRPLLFLGILLVVIGVQFFSIGFLGEMVNKNRVHKYMPGIEKKAGL